MTRIGEKGNDLCRDSAVELTAKISAGEVSARETVEAYIHRIEQVDPVVNAVVVRRFDEARGEADRIDRARQDGAELGPLAGVPITVKEAYFVTGTPATIGLDKYVGQSCQHDGPLIARLREAGAIILGKTNVSQLLILHESDNPVYGRTNNPWDLDRTPGGSSGGGAAAVAAGESALGLGGDLGGSIRIPAHFCGIHGFKPTTGRLTNLGSRVSFNGMDAIGGQAGPFARTVDDLELALRVLVQDPPPHDADVYPVPMGRSDDVDIANLRIGVWNDDGYFPASPAIRRAVDESGAALRAMGAEVEPFQPPGVPESIRMYYGLVSADGTESLRRQLSGGTADKRVARLLRLGGIPQRMRGAMTWWLKNRGQLRLAALVESTGAGTADRYWQLTASKTAYVQRFLASMQARRLDALICPPHALPALRHGQSVDLTTAASYAFVINLLEMPSGVVAASRVRRSEESDRAESRDQVERAARIAEADSAGLPVGVQVAARHWREDIVLAVMKALEQHFRRQPDYPARPTAIE